MMKLQFMSCTVIFILILSSCSMRAKQVLEVTPTSQVSAEMTPTLSSASTQGLDSSRLTQIPVTWAHLHLTGKLVYINGVLFDNALGFQIQILNLVTGEVATIFEAPAHASIYYIAVSPDHQQLVMSYSPPPFANLVDQNLYIMPLDGSQPPQLLFTPPTQEDDYIEAEYSPDGKYIYYTHVNKAVPLEPGQVYPLSEIYRIELPEGRHPQKVAEKASWPRLSADSTYITYVSLDLFSLRNKLYVANADGKNAHEVALGSPLPPEIKDAPIFSPDGQFILFSAPVPVESYQPNWTDKLMSVLIAKAHGDLTSDWWSVPVGGGTITQVTNIQSSDLFASFAPANNYVASSSADGIFVMKPDGTEITMLIPNPQAIMGTVRWIP